LRAATSSDSVPLLLFGSCIRAACAIRASAVLAGLNGRLKISVGCGFAAGPWSDPIARGQLVLVAAAARSLASFCTGPNLAERGVEIRLETAASLGRGLIRQALICRVSRARPALAAFQFFFFFSAWPSQGSFGGLLRRSRTQLVGFELCRGISIGLIGRLFSQPSRSLRFSGRRGGFIFSQRRPLPASRDSTCECCCRVSAASSSLLWRRDRCSKGHRPFADRTRCRAYIFPFFRKRLTPAASRGTTSPGGVMMRSTPKESERVPAPAATIGASIIGRHQGPTARVRRRAGNDWCLPAVTFQRV